MLRISSSFQMEGVCQRLLNSSKKKNMSEAPQSVKKGVSWRL